MSSGSALFSKLVPVERNFCSCDLAHFPRVPPHQRSVRTLATAVLHLFGAAATYLVLQMLRPTLRAEYDAHCSRTGEESLPSGGDRYRLAAS